jgi:hypothetical protein
LSVPYRIFAVLSLEAINDALGDPLGWHVVGPYG